MADSFSGSDCADTEDCSSKSYLSLSVGYYPCEDTFSYENTVSCEDMSSKCPSVHLVPPIQGTWLTDSIGRLLGRRDQIQDDPEQFCKLSITLAWDIDMGSNQSDSITNWDPHGHHQWIGQYTKEKTQLTLSKLDGLVQKLEKFLENQKDEEDDESVFPESAPEENCQLSSSSPPDMAQTISQAPGSQRTSTTETSSVSSDPPEEEDAHSSTQALSCLNIRWVFHWLRLHVLSSFGGRQLSEKATHQLTHKKRLFPRSKRIQPQESLELGPPVPPEFVTF
ncbi:PREDICTED: uncharacterized protein C12orf71 homolog [Hipposideros armiger]|uniref:Uncharacterized protein C12orf71 homolog n=1 Tax=Hipposideros armiger TaxID=186990 RepID=A0A8B7TEP3_HIPAR|nr:PREDICTED: uncharacterized protein C12orf71 homolog [Hipposideros armiger]